jgi:Zn-dependent protease with chaperone function
MAIRTSAIRAAAFTLVVCATAVLQAQTEVKLPKNKFTPEQDVKLGQEAAAEIRQHYPVITDERIVRYLADVGDRLVAAGPAQLKHPAYQYSFTPVNLKEINAFALPGGPMFINRGMIAAAGAEGEVVGVMAHELAHVLLRHGTANVTKAQNPWLQVGQLAGMLGGAMVGGSAGEAIAQTSQFGLGALLLRYGRDFEKQADLLGAQIMARAGYDPRGLAKTFETIEKEAQASGQGGTPQWLSSHPNPGNRSQYITKEAEQLTIGPAADTSRFQPIKTAFASLPPAKSMSELARAGTAAASAAPTSVGTPGQPVPRPSTQYKDITGGKVFQASVPAEWTSVPSTSALKVVPPNGYGQLNGQLVFLYGVEFGLAKANSRDLQDATRAWLNTVAQNNPELRLAGNPQAVRMSQRSAMAVPLVRPSPIGGQEFIGAYTTFLVDGTLFYYLTIVQEKDLAAFQDTFRRVGESIRLTDVR